MIRGHSRPIAKSKTPRAVLLVLSRGVFFCDRPSLTPSDNKFNALISAEFLGKMGKIGKMWIIGIMGSGSTLGIDDNSTLFNLLKFPIFPIFPIFSNLTISAFFVSTLLTLSLLLFFCKMFSPPSFISRKKNQIFSACLLFLCVKMFNFVLIKLLT